MRVSRGGNYDWSQRAESARSRRNRELRSLIRQIHLESNGAHGARKIRRVLLDLGEGDGSPCRSAPADRVTENGDWLSQSARQSTDTTREEAKADFFEYIERFYNRNHSQSYLGYLSFVQFENRTVSA
ncbi:MAG: hypothetical protein KJO27_04745 [Gammaproteobacteria bacterium]|nr:hypothetical protein [Gammaproteobacteria bacterium]NNL44718.1 transposase [Woeseiaceae bacterium]